MGFDPRVCVGRHDVVYLERAPGYWVQVCSLELWYEAGVDGRMWLLNDALKPGHLDYAFDESVVLIPLD